MFWSFLNPMYHPDNIKHQYTQIVYKLSVQSLSSVRLFATPWTAVRQASLSITNSRSQCANIKYRKKMQISTSKLSIRD